jgi:hypothetical protein
MPTSRKTPHAKQPARKRNSTTAGAEATEPPKLKPLTSEQWSHLCAAAAAWYMLTRAKVSELFESVNGTIRAAADENSPLREFLDLEGLKEVRRYLGLAELGFPEFGTAAPTAMNLPELMELLASFK